MISCHSSLGDEQQGLQQKEEEALRQAAVRGDLSRARHLIAKGVDINAQNCYGSSPLLYAATHGHYNMVLCLLAAGADVDIHDRSGWTTIMRAASNGYKEIVRAMLKAGANPDIQSKYGDTALMWCSDKAHADVVEALLEGNANVNIQNQDGRTVLMDAASHGHSVITAMLLQAGADPNLQDVKGRSALMGAILFGYTSVVAALLANGADIHLRTEGGCTCLDFAQADSCSEETKELIVSTFLAEIRSALSPMQSDRDIAIASTGTVSSLQLLTELPEDIYRCFQAFTPINAILNTSRRLADVKRRLYYWNLSRQYSLLYLLSAEFRQLLDYVLDNSRAQVALNFINIADVPAVSLRTATIRQTPLDELANIVHHIAQS